MHTSAYQQALLLLKKASSASGFLASAVNHDNYGRVWTRDGVICGLAALASGDKNLINTFENTLITLFNHQHPSGFFPSNVINQNGLVSYGGSVGRADNPSWAIIGLCSFLLHNPKSELKNKFKNHVEKAFNVLDAWEYNGKHLVYVPLSGDWADEYNHHGYILFDQLLRLWAMELAIKIYANEAYIGKVLLIRNAIENNFHQASLSNNPYCQLLNREKNMFPSNHWIMGFNPGCVYTNFDLQANALALYLNLGSVQMQTKLLNHIELWVRTENKLLPSFFPLIQDNDHEMRVLKNNFAYYFRNKPHEFHNGGLWPVWNGFLLAACKKFTGYQFQETLLQQLEKISLTNFNECYHGNTTVPCGVPECSWSAAGLILAKKGFYEN